MTQEKELLIKDLCGRLMYGVKVEIKSYEEEKKPWYGKLTCKDLDCFLHDVAYYSIKPYLRPLSSMTEEEKSDLEAYSEQELYKYADSVLSHADKDTTRSYQIALIYKDIDWYNKHQFDYRGLIPMGLALEAPDGMYK